MLPTISVFGLTVPMYGLLILTGVVLGVPVAVYLPARREVLLQDVFYCACYAMIGAVVGAKVLYLAVSLPAIIKAYAQTGLTLKDIETLLTQGFVYYGGLGGAVLGVFVYSRQFKLPFSALADSLVLSVPLIHAIGRIGCFCAGCCFGIPAEPPLGVYFHPDSAAPSGTALLPVQLYEAGLNLILFALLFAYSRKPRRDLQISGLYVLSYGVIRFLLEFFRGDVNRGMALGLGTSQWISLAAIPLGLYLWLWRKTERRIREKSE